MGSKKKGQGTFIKEVRFEKDGKFKKRLEPIRNFSDTSQRLQVLHSLGNNCALRPELYHNTRFNFFCLEKIVIKIPHVSSSFVIFTFTVGNHRRLGSNGG